MRLSLWVASLLGSAALLMAPALAQGHDPAHGTHRGAQKPAATGVQVKLDDTLLQDQDGREVRLKSDVFGNRVVVVNFIYTTCTTICPVSSYTIAQLQQRLGPLVGDQVQLVTITVDPLRDTPRRLKENAAKYDAGSGWRWLTGKKANVDVVLKAFGSYTPNPEDHPPITMVGSADGRGWTRVYGFPSVDELQAQVQRALGTPVAANRH